MMINEHALIEEYGSIIGETMWHSLTVDPNIDKISREHYALIKSVLKSKFTSLYGLKILEIGAYAHFTGYLLQKNHGAEVTLLDISPSTLTLGRKIATEKGLFTGGNNPHLVVNDFKQLFFNDKTFDVVFICSSLHHTWSYSEVIDEMIRVLVPGGILIIEKEPCKREACFYKFRTNRLDALTKFENKINEMDMLRTFAEPYLGSRPETLFGMIENQQIPLANLLTSIQRECDLQELSLTMEGTMIGFHEKNWLENKGLELFDLKEYLKTYLFTKVNEIKPYLTDYNKRMGFHLPSSDEIINLSEKVSVMLKSIPKENDEKYRIKLAEIFGAEVRIIAQKSNADFVNGLLSRKIQNSKISKLASKLFFIQQKASNPQHMFLKHAGCEQKDGIYYCLPERIRKLILHQESIIPDIQNTDLAPIQRIFPQDFWQANKNENGIISLTTQETISKIVLPTTSTQLFVSLRIYAKGIEGIAYQVALWYKNQQLCQHTVYQSESFLFISEIKIDLHNHTCELEITTHPIDQEHCGDQHKPLINISSAIAYDLTQSQHVQKGLHYMGLEKITNIDEYNTYISKNEEVRLDRQAAEYSLLNDKSVIKVPGYCYVCKRDTKFHVDFNSWNTVEGSKIPNWRETLICPLCKLNNRMRAAIHIFEQECRPNINDSIYISEQVTPMYRWLQNKYINLKGSEFLGANIALGKENAVGVRNEDMTCLTYENNVFKHILSFDVLEHIPDYSKALKECFRCLTPNGNLLFSVPFLRNEKENIVRARLSSTGELEYYCPPEYHGDPVNTEGVLCFYHFGWSLINEIKGNGFKDVFALLYWSQDYGYLGGEQIIFIARKPKLCQIY